jgi:cysteinyl-tRNA synthetase
MGMTDVDDKIIVKSKQENKNFAEVARFYENAFLEDMYKLGVMRPTYITRVSEHIPDIIKYIEGILSNGHAYVAPSGSVYFDQKSSQYPMFNECEHTEEGK